jgi:hypothetical protein
MLLIVRIIMEKEIEIIIFSSFRSTPFCRGYIGGLKNTGIETLLIAYDVEPLAYRPPSPFSAERGFITYLPFLKQLI